MGPASFVPENHPSDDGTDARKTLQRVGRWRLTKDVLVRFVAASGSSHTRALAFSSVIGIFPGVIAVIGFATTFHLTRFRSLVEQTATGLAPGRSSQVLSQAFRSASSGLSLAALLGGALSMLIAGTIAMAQLERSANRLYGIEHDRPFIRRYARALVLYVTTGTLLLVGLVLLAAGAALGHALAGVYGWGSGAATAWTIVRWPLGIAIVGTAITILFRWCPNLRQPHPSWLSTGTLVAVVLWVAFTAALALYYGSSSSTVQTYGPLLGVIALLVWSYLSSLALHLGLAFCAQLEAAQDNVPPISRVSTDRPAA